ncbi:MAG: YwaF family protein [Clostridia bacterium]|nr:YwaF family protein [Clostridia bacterium]
MGLFDLPHVLYMVISALLTAGGLVAAAYLCKTQRQKDFLLRFFAIITVIIHYSNLWVDYFTTGTAELENNHLLPVYPCNIVMWLLLIAACIKNRDGIAFKMIAEFVFWGGVVCGSVGIIFNTNYDNTPSLRDYDILKGLVSHSTMLFGCIYMLVGKYIRIRVFNVVSCIAGLLFFLLDGAIINGLFDHFGIDPVNAMFLQEPPLPQFPWMSVWLLGAVAVTLLFGALALYEQKCFPENERWYNQLKNTIQKTKEKENV